ncbi:adenylate cyclase [Polyrhizophydium stewartii]|uniref:Adenylate cyclase n=1 Tax=Polyrhizophydium stewartii TaxID=2732419 RepID=A0ABR4N7R4_9FUNG
MSAAEHIAVTRFREYLRIKTVHPNPDYASARTFLEAYAAELGLAFRAVEASGSPARACGLPAPP